jgi:hypothetical protein
MLSGRPESEGCLCRENDLIVLVAARPIESHETAPSGSGSPLLGDLHLESDGVPYRRRRLEADSAEINKGERRVVKLARLLGEATEKEEDQFAGHQSSAEPDGFSIARFAEQGVYVARPTNHLLGLAVEFMRRTREAVADLQAIVGTFHSGIESCAIGR